MLFEELVEFFCLSSPAEYLTWSHVQRMSNCIQCARAMLTECLTENELSDFSRLCLVGLLEPNEIKMA